MRKQYPVDVADQTIAGIPTRTQCIVQRRSRLSGACDYGCLVHRSHPRRCDGRLDYCTR